MGALPDPPPAKPEPRQQRAIETRQRLVEFGRRAFSELGHDGVNLTRDILDPAGVGVGSFYHQFADKTELLVEVLREAAAMRRQSVIEQGFRRSDDLTFEQSIRAALEQMFDSIDREDHAWRAQLNVQWIPEPRVHGLILELQAAFVEQIAAFFAAATSADAAKCERAAVLMFAAGLGFATAYLNLAKGQHALERDDMVEGAAQLITPGLVALLA